MQTTHVFSSSYKPLLDLFVYIAGDRPGDRHGNETIECRIRSRPTATPTH